MGEQGPRHPAKEAVPLTYDRADVVLTRHKLLADIYASSLHEHGFIPYVCISKGLTLD
jgi:hypothetical protein